MAQLNNISSIMVSVCMITYNHENFIEQAIESIIQQKTSFCFELIIGEDASTDKTLSICQQLANKYPDIIKLLPTNGNLGIGKNFYRTLNACNGNYIAVCEGDDFWHDKNKLQTQVDILEKNKDCILCTSNFSVLYEHNKKLQNNINKDIPEIYTFQYKLGGNTTVTNSLIYRNTIKLPIELSKCNVADWPLKLYLLQFGKGIHLNQILSTYRIHSGGIWNGNKEHIRDESTILAFEKIKSAFDKPFRNQVCRLLKKMKYQYAVLYSNLDKTKSRKYFLQIIKDFPIQVLNLKAFVKWTQSWLQ